jgi:hypothetical protein
MIKLEEIQYIEEQIKKSIAEISYYHYQYITANETSNEEKYPGWTRKWIKNRLKDVYFLIMAYIEVKEMPYLLQTFKETFFDVIYDEKKILKEELIHPEGEPELKVLLGYKQFLEPFKFFEYIEIKDLEHKKLDSILRKTDFILKHTNALVETSDDIFNQMKWVLSLYYPSCRYKKNTLFHNEIVDYQPDILIPELKVAVEYKFIKDVTENIDVYIDQINSIANNDLSNFHYDKFIIVIYIYGIEPEIETSIEVAWKSKNFPLNWELIITGERIII